MDDAESLHRVFAGVHGVYRVQNPMIAGHEGEIRQGTNVVPVRHVMPKLTGDRTPIPWLAVDCRRAWAAAKGRPPRGFPMPVRLFERFVGTDLTTMWRRLANHPVPADPAATAKLLDRVTTVEKFLAGPRQG